MIDQLKIGYNCKAEMDSFFLLKFSNKCLKSVVCMFIRPPLFWIPLKYILCNKIARKYTQPRGVGSERLCAWMAGVSYYLSAGCF